MASCWRDYGERPKFSQLLESLNHHQDQFGLDTVHSNLEANAVEMIEPQPQPVVLPLVLSSADEKDPINQKGNTETEL